MLLHDDVELERTEVNVWSKTKHDVVKEKVDMRVRWTTIRLNKFRDCTLIINSKSVLLRLMKVFKYERWIPNKKFLELTFISGSIIYASILLIFNKKGYISLNFHLTFKLDFKNFNYSKDSQNTTFEKYLDFK